jgi:hypothetical protein
MTQHTVQTDTAARAMLLKMVVHQWQPRRHDKRVSAEVAERYKADEAMGSYLKRLVTKEQLRKINTLTDKIRDVWLERTLPWLDQGTRILPNAFYFKTLEGLKALIHQRDDAVLELAHNWEAVIEEARVRLNGLFDANDYPSAQVLRDAYRIDIVPMPFPSSDDFRLGVLGPDSEEDEAALRAEHNAAVKAAVGDALRDVWQRIYDATEKVADRLNAYKVSPDDEKKGGQRTDNPFRDSLIDNLRELIDILPDLNIADDPMLAGMGDKIRQQLCQYDGQMLRDDGTLRKQTALAAESILAQVSDFLG